jgi:aspartyl-tRNA(Asn)/glutamyl-tRNA(Gln) amidotransferase subunit A
MNIISGPDVYDATMAQIPAPDFTKALINDAQGLAIGIPEEYFGNGLDPAVEEAVRAVIEVFRKKGARIVPIHLPHTQYAVATYYIVASSEASSNLQRFDGIRYGVRAAAGNLQALYEATRSQGFGDEAKRRIMLGTYSLSSGYYDAYYLRALRVRRLIKHDFDAAFKEVDVILTPTSPTPAFAIGEKNADPLSMYLSDVYTISANLAGVPAVSFPCGFTSNNNLPIGVQLIAREFREEDLIRLGHTYQSATDFHKRIPKETL